LPLFYLGSELVCLLSFPLDTVDSFFPTLVLRAEAVLEDGAAAFGLVPLWCFLGAGLEGHLRAMFWAVLRAVLAW